jgi:hypothetical protein
MQSMLNTNLVAVKKITNQVALSTEGRAKAEELSHLMEAIGGSTQPLLLVMVAPGEFSLAVLSDEQLIVLEAARILRERNLRAGEMINAFLVNSIDAYRPEILQMAALRYPGAPVVSIDKVTDWRPQ